MDIERHSTPLEVTREQFLRGLLGGAAAAVGFSNLQSVRAEQPLQALPLSAINTEKDIDVILQKTGGIVQKIGRLFPDAETRVNALGARLSNWWKGADGFGYMEHQRGRIQEFPSGEIALWNELDNMSEYGLDSKLDDGSFGVTIPPQRRFQDKVTEIGEIFNERAGVLGMPADVLARAQEIREYFEIGVPTGFKDYGPYSVWRFQRAALQKWNDGSDKGLIQGILTGEAAIKVGGAEVGGVGEDKLAADCGLISRIGSITTFASFFGLIGLVSINFN